MVPHRLNFFFVAGCSFLTSTILTFGITQTTDIVTLLAVTTVNQFAHGSFAAGSNPYLFHLWGKETGPYLQGYMFMFGAGGLISPLIVSHFQKAPSSMNSSLFHVITMGGVLFWPFAIVSAFQLISSLLAFMIHFTFPVPDPHPSREKLVTGEHSLSNFPQENVSKPGDVQELETGLQSSLCGERTRQPNASSDKIFWKAMVLVFAMMFMHLFMGVQTCFANFLATFAVTSGVHLSKDQGAELTSLYWLTYTFFRVISIFYINRIGPGISICLGMIILLGANALFFPFGDSNVSLLVTAVAVAGMGGSTLWGCVYGFLEDYIPINRIVTACIITSAYMGELTFPSVLANWIDRDPGVLQWVVLMCSLGLPVSFAFMFLTCRIKLRQ